MLLSTLLEGIVTLVSTNDCTVTSLTLDSRSAKPGALFFAYQGTVSDGRDYIEAAIKQGATAILADSHDYTPGHSDTPIILVDDLQNKIGLMAARFYGHPSKEMTVIGVTGTNGKTSVSHIIAEILTASGISTGIMGTLGSGHPGNLTSTGLTTSSAIACQAAMAEFLKTGTHHVAMEVSSHALDQGRVSGLQFTTAIFTNLTRDHLD